MTILSHHDINVLVTAAIQRRIAARYHDGPESLSEPVTEANAQAVGVMLWTSYLTLHQMARGSLQGTQALYTYRRAAPTRKALGDALQRFQDAAYDAPGFDQSFAADFLTTLAEHRLAA